MNVLLIYPRFPDTFWSFRYALSFLGKKAAFPPLGLLTIAALLPAEWSRRLVAVNVENLTDDDRSCADMAFICGMAVQQESAKKIIARCRAKGLKVIADGPLFTGVPDEFEEVDHLVLDEAELTLPSFIEDLQNGRLKRVYRASRFCDIHHTPHPFLEFDTNETICFYEHSVFERLSVQLRILQCDGPFWPSTAPENVSTGNRRAGSCL